MQISDARSIDNHIDIEADICLVGSGPAGWTIAETLRESGLSVLILESGGLNKDDALDELNQIEHTGAISWNGRNRVLGGTSESWGGRCIAFDDIDYEERSWVRYSGWPLTKNEIGIFLSTASEFLNVGPYSNDGSTPLRRGLQERPVVYKDLLTDLCWEDPKPIHFGARFKNWRGDNLRILVNATVTHINTDIWGRVVESLEVADRNGRRLSVKARATVLCAGGLENPRLLLTSNRIVSNGLGNAYDAVGRYFMDHPRDPSLIVQFDPKDANTVRDLFGPYKLDSPRGRHGHVHGYGLSQSYQKRHQLLNCSAWPFEVIAQDDPIDAAGRLFRRQTVKTNVWKDLKSAFSHPAIWRDALHARFIADQRVRHRVQSIGFLVGSEQAPDPDSRIDLGDKTDRFGSRLIRLNWKIGEQERRSQAVLAQLIAAEFSRLDLPAVHLVPWVKDRHYSGATFVDGCHPTGATRMAADPRFGVVDKNCRVHGVEGLYIAGSSVFPTAGHVNPTLMIVTLAARLGLHLRDAFCIMRTRTSTALIGMSSHSTGTNNRQTESGLR